MGRGGSGILVPPAVYSSLRAPGGYGRTAAAVGAHTHAHNALTALLNDDHSQYLLAPRAKLRIVAPTGAPYSDPKTAIEACAAGDTVLILGGTYDIAATITIPANNIAILGASRDGVVLNFTAAGATHCISATSKNGVQVRDLSVIFPAGKTGNCVNASGCSDWLIENVYFEGPIPNAKSFLYFYTSGARHRFHRCQFLHNSNTGPYLIYLSAVTDCELDGCHIISTSIGTPYCIIIWSADRSFVTRNRVRLTGAGTACSALYIRDSNHVRLSGNIIVADDPGAWFGAQAYTFGAGNWVGCVIDENTFVSAGDVGIGIWLTSGAAGSNFDDAKIADNLVLDFATGCHLVNVRVREARVHDNAWRTCAAGLTDAGTNTDAADNT